MDKFSILNSVVEWSLYLVRLVQLACVPNPSGLLELKFLARGAGELSTAHYHALILT
jgi:hypothetical protein